MAIEPKTPRKRAAKKATAVVSTDTGEIATKKTPVKKSAAAIPVPMFQAAPVAQAKPARVSRAKAATEESAPESVVKKATSRKKAVPAVIPVATEPEAASSADSEGRGRRRRRGGRGRRRPNELDVESTESDVGDSESEKSATHRRRRRRSSTDGVTPGETVEEDGVITVVKVREPREPREVRERPARGAARDRAPRRTREARSEYREPYRKRGTIITEGEFLARRENVDREMLVRQIGDRTQICVIEDKVMVEHYVNRHTNVSYVGNVYLGRVQNVLPSMEAAFVDIGKGRNAVLYAAEVNWDAAGISDSQPRKIEMVLKTGQPVLVQVTKDPIGQKGARLTSQISLPGRYLVYVPGGGMSGISRRLPEPERARLKTILKAVVPDEAGVIVRTAAEGTSDAEIEADVARLKTQWDDIVAKSENPNFHAPALLYSEPDLAVRVIRDIFNEDFRKLTIQGNDAWEEINNYLGFIAPELTSKIEKWTGLGDLFTDYRVDEQLAKAFDRKVYLPSGGSLVIDRTEAMIVIDVNTGKFIGKGGSLEETVTKNNLEAAEEISRQLRLRDLGGIIVIDFIDMILESNRELVLRRLVECLGRDRTKHQVAEVTSLGLVQMTRKRVGQGLIEAFSTPCETCGGRGIHIQTDPVKARPSLPFGGQNGLGDVHDAIEHEVTEMEEVELEVESGEDYEASGESETAEMPHVVTPEPAKGRRRRRAASSGVITPGA
ncbi:MAG TPA: Rne/Rng family ribonuclease [Candidatus Paceibacterota bacterium]|nr:Rne/Rng family ribonuclease [Candidatus Paceibacterota bacterium]